MCCCGLSGCCHKAERMLQCQQEAAVFRQPEVAAAGTALDLLISRGVVVLSKFHQVAAKRLNAYCTAMQ